MTRRQADSEGRLYAMRFDLAPGTVLGTKATFDLHNIGTTKSGKTISTHVKFVLDKSATVQTQFGVVPDKFLAMYFYNNRTSDQKGHFEVEFFDEATGEPMNLITAFVSSDIDGITEKNYVGSNGKIDGKVPTLSSDPNSTKYPEIGYVSSNELYYAGKADYFDIDRESATPYGQGLTLVSGSKLTLGFGVGADSYGAYNDFSLTKIGSKSKETPNKPVMPEKPIPTPMIDEPEKPALIEYHGNNGTPNTTAYNRVLIRQLTTKWVDKDGKELKAPVTGTDIEPADTIPHYVFDRDETDGDGNVTHVYKQFITKWIDQSGKELKDPVKDGAIQDKGTIDHYVFVETKTEGDVTTHVFKQLNTRWVDENLENILEPVSSEAYGEQKEINGYKFVEQREADGTRTYIYHKITTTWVEENTSKELKREDKLVREPGDINSYVYVRTETKENGDLVHIFKKVEQKKNDVPTGVKSNIILTGITLILSALGITILNKKKREA